mmetsp:Transcript_28391/g.66466  ORF Transcript_28391/g.66466 Transcript_28391/m.66466 type:complete len:358 (+) Transcript_28391:277-1350(+)
MRCSNCCIYSSSNTRRSSTCRWLKARSESRFPGSLGKSTCLPHRLASASFNAWNSLYRCNTSCVALLKRSRGTESLSLYTTYEKLPSPTDSSSRMSQVMNGMSRSMCIESQIVWCRSCSRAACFAALRAAASSTAASLVGETTARRLMSLSTTSMELKVAASATDDKCSAAGTAVAASPLLLTLSPLAPTRCASRRSCCSCPLAAIAADPVRRWLWRRRPSVDGAPLAARACRLDVGAEVRVADSVADDSAAQALIAVGSVCVMLPNGKGTAGGGARGGGVRGDGANGGGSRGGGARGGGAKGGGARGDSRMAAKEEGGPSALCAATAAGSTAAGAAAGLFAHGGGANIADSFSLSE